jgi:hypothetical protein
VRKGEKWIEFLEGAFASAFASAFAIHFFVVVVSMTEGASAYKGGQTSLLCIRLLWCKHEYVLVQSESLPSSSLHPHLHEKLISFLHYVFSTSLHALTIIKFSLLLTRNEKKKSQKEEDYIQKVDCLVFCVYDLITLSNKVDLITLSNNVDFSNAQN